MDSFLEESGFGALGVVVEREEKALLCLLEDAPIYRKRVRVLARPARDGEIVETILRSGYKENENRAKAGDWVITNPLGESYTVSRETFEIRYEATGKDGVYRARGRVRALKNPFARSLFLRVSWGEMQQGDTACMIAVACDAKGEISDRAYLIDKRAFCKTYKKVF